MSYLTIRDKPTKDLMTSWYKQIEEGIPGEEALRATQLAALRGESLPETDSTLSRGARPPKGQGSLVPALKGSRHPYYWASFILSGETGPIQPK